MEKNENNKSIKGIIQNTGRAYIFTFIKNKNAKI